MSGIDTSQGNEVSFANFTGGGVNKRRKLVVALGASALVSPVCSFAQQKGRVWRIGILDTTTTSRNAENLDAFRKRLHELGYVEGQNLVIEYRSADAPERLAEQAIELVRAKVDVIVPRGTPASQAAKNATGAIPIVVAEFGSPVESGLVKSLSHPGGNLTGLSSVTPDLSAKRVELIKQMAPAVKRIGALTNLSNADSSLSWKQTEREGQSLGVDVQLLDVRRSGDMAPAFEAASRQGVGALVIIGYALTQPNLKLIVELAASHRLPTIYPAPEFVKAGGLMSYGVDYTQLYYRAASLVDQIFKGANPADIPVEQATNFILVINVKTAKALGLTIPQALLARADDVIQ